ncbi:MAG: bacteriohemerythrin [Methylophaga sp.]|nr:bacteriohemerythrin [Methylophaga sp.]
MGKHDITFFEIFPWNKNFETGIALIDEQHKQLVHILNKLAAHLANYSDEEILNNIFDELADYADYHFKAEEQIWSAHFKDDDWLANHEHTHESFIDKVIALKKEENDKPLDDVIQEIISFLAQWLAYHILESDKRMAKVVLAMESGEPLEQAKNRADEEMSGSMQVLINTVLTMYDSLSTRTLDLMREKTLRMRAEEALSRSEERWQFILEGGAEGVWDWDIEQDTVYHSEEELSLFDIVGDKTKGKGVKQKSNIHPADRDRVEADLHAHLDGKTEFYINKHRVLLDNGSWSWVLSRGKVVSRDEHGTALRMVGTHSDITERELASLIYRHSSQALFVTNANNDIISINSAFTDITGYSEQEVIGANPRFLSSGKHNAMFYQQMWEAINATGHWEGEICNQRKNGDIYTENLKINTVVGPNGLVDHHIALFSDITEKKKADELIVQHANFDMLTQLPNRHLFQEHLQFGINKAQRSGLPIALLFIDLDRFKEVNDSFGHDVGDMLLIETAQRINSCVRESDTVARIGGDEFTVILAEIKDLYIIERITQKIIDALNKPYTLGNNHAYVSASVGITLYPDDSTDVASMLKLADQAMYKAKARGRNCYSYFTQAMQEEAQRHQQLIIDLRSAVQAGEFELYYQPIVDSKTGEIRKAEALLRWNHPTDGMISPADFIPLAEESGLIVEIGDWVFKQVVNQAKLWTEKYDVDFQISINKSPIQFLSGTNHEHWLEYLAELDLLGQAVVIEITEGLLLESDQNIINQLLQFHDAGIQVALDDFGTGYSALAYLKKFDIDYLKIDRSFIQGLAPDSDDMALSEAIIVMAHTLGLKVIAEGVETEQQLQLLKKVDCDYIQGYLVSKPVPAEAFEQLLGKA